MDTMEDFVDIMDMDTLTMDTMAERRGKLKLHLHLMLRPMLRQILTTTTDTATDILTMDMDTPISMAERRGKLRLSPKLKLIPKLIPGMDTMDTILVDTMDLDTMDMDTLIDTSTMVKGGKRLQYL